MVCLLLKWLHIENFMKKWYNNFAMKNIEFLNQLNMVTRKYLEQRYHSNFVVVDMGIYDVEGTKIGLIVYQNKKHNNYEARAYAEYDGGIAECGMVNFSLSKKINKNDWDDNGELETLYVFPHFRNNKMPSSKRTQEQINPHIGTFLLSYAENMITNGAKFNTVILNRKLYDYEVETEKKVLNKNKYFYEKQGYVYRSDERYIGDKHIEPYIKYFLKTNGVYDAREIQNEQFETKKETLVAQFSKLKFEQELFKHNVINILQLKSQNGKIFVLVEQKGNKKGNYDVLCYEAKTILSKVLSLKCVGKMTFTKGTQNYKDDNRIISATFSSLKSKKTIGEILLNYCQDRLFAFGVNAVGIDYDVANSILENNNNYKCLLSGDFVFNYNNSNSQIKRVCPIKFVAEDKAKK